MPTSDKPKATAHPRLGVACEIAALRDVDLLRLEAIARLRARGLPGLDGSDLLNEAILRLLTGSRRRPEGIPLVAVLAMTMRSIGAEHWRRAWCERPILVADSRLGRDEADPSPEANPERVAAAVETLAGLDRLFARDPVVLNIMAGLADGLSAIEIRSCYGLSETTYDTARRRMRRALFRYNKEATAP